MLKLVKEEILAWLDCGIMIAAVGFNTEISIILYQYFGSPYILLNI